MLSIRREVYLGELRWTKSAFISELTSPFMTLYLGIFDREIYSAFVGSRVLGLDCHLTNIAVSQLPTAYQHLFNQRDQSIRTDESMRDHVIRSTRIQ